MANIKFEASAIESKLAREWVTEHLKTCKVIKKLKEHNSGGNTISYLFTPTGIGTGFEVMCSCGESYNVTDFDSW